MTTGKTRHPQDLPSPSSIALNSYHLGNQRRQRFVERAGADASAEEDDAALQGLVSVVIRADEVRSAQNKGGLGHAFEEPAGDETSTGAGEAAADDGGSYL